MVGSFFIQFTSEMPTLPQLLPHLNYHSVKYDNTLTILFVYFYHSPKKINTVKKWEFFCSIHVNILSTQTITRHILEIQ